MLTTDEMRVDRPKKVAEWYRSHLARNQAAKMLDMANHLGDDVIDFFHGVESSQAETQAGMGLIVGEPHGLENGAGFHAG